MTISELFQFFPLLGYLVSGIFGLVIGSFLTFVTYRIKAKEPWLWGRGAAWSKCPACGTVLRARDLIPVLSWVFSGGKCRHCDSHISIRYPLIEIATAIVFMCVYNFAF